MVVTVLVIGLVFLLVILSLAVASMASSYRILFEKLKRTTGKKLHDHSAETAEASEELLEVERLRMKEELDRVIGHEAGRLEEVLAGVKEEASKIFSEIAAESKSEVRQDLLEFRKELDAKIAGEVEKTKTELDKYKADKAAAIDQRAKAVLQEVAQSVLGATIDIDKHEELLMKSLKKAKDEKFFGI